MLQRYTGYVLGSRANSLLVTSDWKLLTIITKHSILDVAAALDSPLPMFYFNESEIQEPSLTVRVVLFKSLSRKILQTSK